MNSLVQQILIECLLCAKDYSRLGDSAVNKSRPKVPAFMELGR